MFKNNKITLAILVATLLINGCSDGKTSEKYFELGRNHQAKGDSRAAMIEYKNSIRQDPTNNKVRLALGKLYLENDQYTSAKKELERSMRDSTLQRDSLLPLALVVFKQRKYQELLMLPLLTSDLRSDDLVVAYVLRGQALMTQGKREQALAEYSLATELNEEAAYARLGQVMSASANTDFSQGIELVKALLDDYPDMKEAVLLYAGLLHTRGDYKNSVVAYDKYIALNNGSASHINLLLINSLISNGDSARAKDELNKLLKINDKQPVVNAIFAKLLYQENNIEQALKHALIALDTMPNNASANLIAAMSLFREGKHEVSYRHFTRISRYTSGKAMPQIMQMINNIKLGHVKKAQSAALKLPQPDKNTASLYVLAANEFAVAQDYKTSLNLVEQAVVFLPDDNKLLLKRGALKVKLGIASGADDIARGMLVPKLAKRVLPQVIAAYVSSNRFDDLQQIADQLKLKYDDKSYGWDIAAAVPLYQKDFKLSEKLFIDNLDKFPKNPVALRNLANLRLIEEDVAGALDYTQKLLVVEPDNFPALEFKARLILRQTKDVEQYKAVFKTAYTATPNSESLLVKRAVIHVSEGEIEQGIELLESIRSRDNLSTKYWQRYGDLLALTRQSEQALEIYRQWQKLAPNSPLPLLKQIALNEKMGRYNDGLRLVESVAKKFRHLNNLDGLRINLMMLDGQLGSARRLFKTYQQNPDNAANLSAIEGELLFREKKYPQAISELTDAYASSKKARYALLVAKANMAQQQTESAITVLKQHLDLEPLNRPVKSLLATIYTSINSPLAISIYEELVTSQPQNSTYLNNLAWILSEHGQLEKALTYIERAIKLKPDNPQILDSYGVILFKMKQHQQAIEQFDKAIRIAPQGINFTLHKAEVLIAMAKKTQAKVLLDSLGNDIPKHLKLQLILLREQLSS
jgi:putative PEP-CTERM system TPR-repeat lipoprotein